MAAEYVPMSGDAAKIELAELPVPTDGERFSYWFDNFFSSDPLAKPVVLTAVNVFFMTVFALCFYAAGSQDRDLAENFWMGFTFAADMAEDDHGGPFPYWHQWIFRAMNLTFSFGGAFVFGLVINFLSDFITSKVEGLKLGKSRVIEQDQTLILGWNDRILPLVDQLTQANESDGGKPIVILADRDKVAMDEYFMDALEDTRGSKIVTRSGSRIEVAPLLHVSVSTSRSVIILSEGTDADEADCGCIRCTLALTCGLPPGRSPKCHFVVELQDVDNADVCMLGVADGVDANDVLVPIISHDMAGKLMIQSAREIGLSKCFAGLLCFEGSECYFSEWPELIGTSFRDICFSFKDAVVVGLRFNNPETSPNGRPVMLNPPHDYLLQYGDKVLVLAEDNDTYEPGSSNEQLTTPLPPFELPAKQPEKILLCGWRRDFDDMIMELDKWCPPGSTVTVMSVHNPDDINGLNQVGAAKIVEGWKLELAAGGMEEFWDQTLYEWRDDDGNTCPSEDDPNENFMVTGNFKMENLSEIDFVYADPTIRRDLENMPLEQYDAGMVLTLDPELSLASDTMSADSRAMVSMLLLRSIMTVRKWAHATLVAEIQDPRTQTMMSLTRCSDSVVGNEVVSMMLAQCSEERDNGYVIDDLFAPEGAEMHVKDIRLFCAPDEKLCYWDLLARALMRNMLVLGWIRKNDNLGPNDDPADSTRWTAILNPEDKFEKLEWVGKPDQSGDMLIVISED